MSKKHILILVGLVLIIVTLVLVSIYAAEHIDGLIDKVRALRTYIDYGAIAFIVIAICVVTFRYFRGKENDRNEDDNPSAN